MARADVLLEGNDALVADLKAIATTLRGRVQRDLRVVSLKVERRIKDAMPVDTGRARASWGHFSAGDLRGANPDASSSDAIWQESGDSITQGSNVEYIDSLDAGHSRQSPAGFIEVAQIEGERELEAVIAAEMDRTR